jgi:hypothetical protein
MFLDGVVKYTVYMILTGEPAVSRVAMARRWLPSHQGLISGLTYLPTLSPLFN